MERLSQAFEQIQFARKYTLRLLDSIDTLDWFRFPPGGISTIGWQVGHLAMAQYRLALERIRGTQPEDRLLLTDDFLKMFGRDSTPDANCPWNAGELREALARVHRQFELESAHWAHAGMEDAPHKPHSLAATKMQCLLWCSSHEMIHAGQIGLLRRQLGLKPLW